MRVCTETDAPESNHDCVRLWCGAAKDRSGSPVATGGWLVGQRGSRFSLGSNQGLDILAPSNSPFSRRVDCETFAVPSDDPLPNRITPRAAPVDTSPSGSSGLSVNNQGVYRQNWQTSVDWVDTCRELVLTRADGVQHRAFFRFVEAS